MYVKKKEQILICRKGLIQIKIILINEILCKIEKEQDMLIVPKKYRVNLLLIKKEMKDRLKNKRLIENKGLDK